MVLLPVAAREVREASRQTRTYAWRAATAGVALAVMAFITWVSRYSMSQGHDLFVAVSTIAYIYCLIAGVVRTADTIAEEKRENTLGLLFLTDLKGWDIILGKLLSSSANCLFGLLALIPMLAIPMMMGGVQMIEFVRVILTLIVTLLLSISWGFLISSLFRLSVVTISSGLAVVILIAGGLPLLSVLLAEEFHLRMASAIMFVISPTHSLVFSFDTSMPSWLYHFWTSISVNFAIALLILRMAIFFLPRFWQEAPKNKKTETWRNCVRAWRFGKPKAKTRLRKRLLNQNPFFWLANREQISSAGLMLTSVVILFGAVGIGIASTRGAWRGTEEIMIWWIVGMVFVHIIVAFRMAMSASYRLAEDRRSGALELLLGTEVSIRQLLRGYWMALGRQFFGPVMICLFGGAFAASMILMLFSDRIHAGNIFATMIEIIARIFRRGGDSDEGLIFLIFMSIQGMLMLNWIALLWVGMWLGLREKRAGVATWATLATVYVPPWVLLIVGMITFVEMGLSRGMTQEVGISSVLLAGWTLGGANVLLLSVWARKKLLGRFREAAADRYLGPRRIAWPKIRRVAIRFAIAGACIVLLLYGARYIIDRRGEKAWRQALAAFPNFQLQKQKPARPHIADDQNLAKAPFFSPLISIGNGRLPITWTLNPRSSGYDGETLQWEWSQKRRMNLAHVEDMYIDRKILKQRADTAAETILGGLSIYEARLDELREEARDRPLLQYPVSTPADPIYSGPYAGFSVYGPRQGDIRIPLRQLVETIALRTSAILASKSPTNIANVDDLLLAMRLSEGVRDLPQATAQYHELILDCVQPTYDGLSLRAWKNDDLKRIQDCFAKVDLWTDYETYREDYLRQSLNESEQIVMSQRRPGQNSWLAREAPTGFRRQWQAETLRWGMTTLPKIADTKTRRIDPIALRDLLRNRPATPTGFRYPDQISGVIRGLAFTQTTIDQIVLACAIERFRNDINGLPKKLQDLVPKYISAIPNDVFTGQPLNYRISEDTRNYVIYSVGTDGQNNQGRAGSMSGSWMLWQDQPDTDWIWSSEATDPGGSRKKTKTSRK
jgi:ABC-type transport system involved in multi-copper enzyme maturation permease subunit